MHVIPFDRQSYDVEIEVVVEGTGVCAKNILDLKNPFFRYTGIQTVAPPGNHSQSPTDAYWGNAGVVLNGGVLSNTAGSYGTSQGSVSEYRFSICWCFQRTMIFGLKSYQEVSF